MVTERTEAQTLLLGLGCLDQTAGVLGRALEGHKITQMGPQSQTLYNTVQNVEITQLTNKILQSTFSLQIGTVENIVQNYFAVMRYYCISGN